MNQNNNRYNLDPKYVKCAGCDKPAEPRWKWGPSNPIIPYKGPKGEELCHKCASCAKCGKETYKSYESGLCRYEKTNDNPSGEWVLAYCSRECFDGTEKPSLPKKEPEKTAKCDHCGKLGEIKVGNTFWGKSFCSGNCYELAFARLPSTKTRDEINAHCCICSFRIFGEDGNFTEDFKNRKGKVYLSDSSFHSKYCSKACFEKRGDKSGASISVFYDRNPTQSDNSPKPNPAAPASQPITNSDHPSDTVKANPDNSPKLGTNQTLETKLSPKLVDKQKDGLSSQPNEPKKDEHQVLVINLKDIKKISLVGDNLVIEFNQDSPSQTVVSEQVRDNPVLSKVKNYLQSAQRSTLSQSELASFLSQANTDRPVSNSAPTSPNPLFWTAVGIIGITVMVGLLLLVAKIKKPNSAKQK